MTGRRTTWRSWPLSQWWRIALTLVLLGLIVWRLGGIATVVRLIGSTDPRYALLTVLVITLDRLLMTYKWTRLLRGQGIDLPLINGMKIYCASMVWGIFLPSTVGADAVRAYSTSRLGADAQRTIASIVVERILGFLASLLVGMAAVIVLSQAGLIDDRFDRLWWAGGTALAGAMMVFTLSFHQGTFNFFTSALPRRLRDSWVMYRLREFQEKYRTYRHNKRILLAFFGLTLLEQMVTILYVWLVARALGVPVSLLVVAGALPLALLISRIPVSIHGIGVFDGVFMLLLVTAGVQPAQAIAISVLLRVLEASAWLPWWMAHAMNEGSLRPPAVTSRAG